MDQNNNNTSVLWRYGEKETFKAEFMVKTKGFLTLKNSQNKSLTMKEHISQKISTILWWFKPRQK